MTDLSGLIVEIEDWLDERIAELLGGAK